MVVVCNNQHSFSSNGERKCHHAPPSLSPLVSMICRQTLYQQQFVIQIYFWLLQVFFLFGLHNQLIPPKCTWHMSTIKGLWEFEIVRGHIMPPSIVRHNNNPNQPGIQILDRWDCTFPPNP
eukprot:TRINITY_DN88323_c0_g1_i1.p1 TRINITY_DN88323_c0_g1~~TRINITY_DN88323_c0_g1_i1.p1  ORF type:complete len:129 (+),score=5.36 TRINITY_DN88323_c0_g1_i1:27-389(+)